MVEVVLLAVAWSGAVGLLGLLALRLPAGRSVRVAVPTVAVVGVLSVLAGVVGAARAMFISAHDLGVVVQVAAVAGAVAVLLALVAVRSVVRDVETVRRRAERIAGPGPGGGERHPTGPPGMGGTAADDRPRLAELVQIHGDLDDASDRLVRAAARERDLEASRRELVAWVSHDLRTPLAGIRAMAEALEDGIAPDPARYHRQIVREVDRLTVLVGELFELSSIQAGGLRLTVTRVDLRGVADEAVVGLAGAAAARGVRLHPVATSGGPVQVDADEAALVRVVSNLVANAVRCSPRAGDVRVLVSATGDGAVVAVEDSCGGIPVEHRERVFEPGWRGSGARTPEDGVGGGLGLAVARGLARAHGGDVVLSGVPGGCRFELRLQPA